MRLILTAVMGFFLLGDAIAQQEGNCEPVSPELKTMTKSMFANSAALEKMLKTVGVQIALLEGKLGHTSDTSAIYQSLDEAYGMKQQLDDLLGQIAGMKARYCLNENK